MTECSNEKVLVPVLFEDPCSVNKEYDDMSV